MGAKLDADAMLRREGVVDADVDAYTAEARRAIGEYVADYRSHLEGKRSGSHAATQLGRVEKIIDAAGVRTWGGLTPDAVERAVVALAAEQGLTPQTRNAYLTAFKRFGTWLVRRKRAAANPAKAVDRVAVGEREHRRALLPEEAVRLLHAAAATGEPMRGLTRAGLHL